LKCHGPLPYLSYLVSILGPSQNDHKYKNQDDKDPNSIRHDPCHRPPRVPGCLVYSGIICGIFPRVHSSRVPVAEDEWTRFPVDWRRGHIPWFGYLDCQRHTVRQKVAKLPPSWPTAPYAFEGDDMLDRYCNNPGGRRQAALGRIHKSLRTFGPGVVLLSYGLGEDGGGLKSVNI
jgi:hypothetical protein